MKKLKLQREWEDWFEDLKEYGRTHGDCNVPATYEIPNTNLKLGVWLSNQRQKKKRGVLRDDR